MSDPTPISVPTFYSNGPLYNLISDERGSFYRDVHGLVDLISELPLDHGILELGCGWDERGALLIQHELRDQNGEPTCGYERDAHNFVDLTQPGALAPAWSHQKFSVVTGLCYLLNALNTVDPAGPCDYYDLVVALKNVRSVLVDGGSACFGIYEPGIDPKALTVNFSASRQPNPWALKRLDPTLPKGSILNYDVKQYVENGQFMTCEFHNVSIGKGKDVRWFDIETPLWTTLWTDTDIHNAALEAGFVDIQFFDVQMTTRNGYSEFNVVDCTKNPVKASHVLLLS